MRKPQPLTPQWGEPIEIGKLFSPGDWVTFGGDKMIWTVTAVSDENGVIFAPGHEPRPRKSKGWRKHQRRIKALAS